MASGKEAVQDLQASILQKINDKTVEEHLKTFTSKDTAVHLYKALTYFRDALIGQPIYILDALSENKLFSSWLLNAAKVLSELILDSKLKEEPFPLIEKIQPLIDLFYYFNKTEFIMEVLFEIEVIKAITLDIQTDKLASYPSGIDLLNYRIKVDEQVQHKIQRINQQGALSLSLEQLNPAYMELLDASMRDDGSVNFETLFLELFVNDPDLQILCVAIRNAKQWPIDWLIVLRCLSEYTHDELSKSERNSLRERTKFFTHVLVLTNALKPIPKIISLELSLERIKNASSSMEGGLLELLTRKSDDDEEIQKISYLKLPPARIKDTSSSMASELLAPLEPKNDGKEALKSTPLKKFGDIIMPKILEELDLVSAFRSKDYTDRVYEAIACFCHALSEQPKHILDKLYKDKIFSAWLRKAVNFLSGLFLNTSIFNPELQEGIQPLIDLLYSFNKVDSTIESVLFRFELVKLLSKKYTLSPESQEAFIEDAIRFYNVFIEQPIYVLNSLYHNNVFTAWIPKIVNFLLQSFSDGSMFDSAFQKRIQPLIELLYYFNTVDSTIISVLLRFEVTKLLTKNPQKNLDIYEGYFKDQVEKDVLIDPHEFRAGHRTFAGIINVIFENCYSEKNPEFQLNSRLERACFIAWLVPHIKKQLHQKNLANEPLFEKLFIYLQEMNDVYLSTNTINKTYLRFPTNRVFPPIPTKGKTPYSDNTSDNTSITEQFEKADGIVNKRLKSINAREPSKVELKTSFLKLFSSDPMFSFFFSSKYQIVHAIKETDDLYIDWHYVLAQLLAEIEKPPVDESDIVNLANFIEIQVETLRLKIPALNELNLPAAEIRCSSGPSSPKK